MQGPGRKDRPLTTSRVVFILTAALILAADLFTKYIVVSSMHLREVKRVFGDWVRLTYIHNTGAAFGLFPGSRVALIVVSAAAVIIVTAVAWNRRTRLRTVLPLGLILGGALGNLVDRIRLGKVVDFVQVGIPPENYWPVFNLADSAVTVGVAWLALGLMTSKHEEARGVPAEGGDLTMSEERIAPLASPGDER